MTLPGYTLLLYEIKDWKFCLHVTYRMCEPVNANLYRKIVCTSSKVSYQPRRPFSQSRIFAVRLYRTLVLSLQKSTEQTFWSDLDVVQSGQSLCWTHSLFCHEQNHIQSNMLLFKTSPPWCFNTSSRLQLAHNASKHKKTNNKDYSLEEWIIDWLISVYILKTKVTLHCSCIYLFQILIGDIINVFDSY